MPADRPMLYDEFVRECPRSIRDQWVSRIGKATIVVADNVVEYLSSNPEWVTRDRADFYGVRLPWESAWIEASIGNVANEDLQVVRRMGTYASKMAVYVTHETDRLLRCVFFGKRSDADMVALLREGLGSERWVAGSFALESDANGDLCGIHADKSDLAFEYVAERRRHLLRGQIREQADAEAYYRSLLKDADWMSDEEQSKRTARLKTLIENTNRSLEVDINSHASSADICGAMEACRGFGVAVTCMVMAFLNCRNIVRVESPIAPRRVKDKIHPVVRKSRFYTLRVQPTTQVTDRDSAGDPKADAKLPEHIVRGHFKRFTAERPLFGRIVGQFWWTPQVRGDRGLGRIEKAYEPEGPPHG